MISVLLNAFDVFGSANAVSTFSITTTAASTSMPIAMANPPKLIKLAVRPNAFININVERIESGSTAATTSAAR